MKNNQLYFVCVVLFAFGIIGCKNAPGPATSVSGTITDYNTKKPIGGIRLMVIQQKETDFGSFLGALAGGSGPSYREYDPITTNADGTYKYSFQPDDSGDCTLNLSLPDNYVDQHSGGISIALGGNYILDYSLQKMIKINLHLINTSNHNAITYRLAFNTCCYVIPGYNSWDSNLPKSDTIFHEKIPRLSNIDFSCVFYGATISTFTSPSYKFNSGSNDTTVTITNP